MKEYAQEKLEGAAVSWGDISKALIAERESLTQNGNRKLTSDNSDYYKVIFLDQLIRAANI